jgi:hypothetical protein
MNQTLNIMKAFALALPILLASLSGLAMEPPNCFLGRWKSDESLTLADMRKHPEVTDKARSLFENRFFGRLVLINGSHYGAAYFEDDPAPQALTFEPYDVVERGADWMILRSTLLGFESRTKWFCEDHRIYALVSKWEFREYFSPLP